MAVIYIAPALGIGSLSVFSVVNIFDMHYKGLTGYFFNGDFELLCFSCRKCG